MKNGRIKEQRQRIGGYKSRDEEQKDERAEIKNVMRKSRDEEWNDKSRDGEWKDKIAEMENRRIKEQIWRMEG